jgi:hypothetical protein
MIERKPTLDARYRVKGHDDKYELSFVAIIDSPKGIASTKQHHHFDVIPTLESHATSNRKASRYLIVIVRCVLFVYVYMYM